MNDTYFSGQGDIYIAPVVNGLTTRGLRPVGTCDKLEFGNDQTFDEIHETSTGNSYVDARVATKTLPKITMNLKKWSIENLMDALYGTSEGPQEGGSATGVQLRAFPDSYVDLPHQNVSAVVLTAGATPLVAGTDYTLDAKNGMIRILPGSTVVAGPGPTVVSAAYTYAGFAGDVHAFSTGAQEYTIRLVGINRNDPTAPVIVDVFRVQLDLTKTLNLIDEKHGSLSLGGMILRDATRPSGSEFFKIRKN